VSVDGDRSTAVGHGAAIAGDDSVALGENVLVDADDAVAIGQDARVVALATNGIAIGSGGARAGLRLGW